MLMADSSVMLSLSKYLYRFIAITVVELPTVEMLRQAQHDNYYQARFLLLT